MHWMYCSHCEHIFSRDYFTPDGLTVLFGKSNPSQVGVLNLDLERQRWAPSVEKVQLQLEQPAWAVDDAVWLDVGCGSGGLVVTASEYGFAAIGLDTRSPAVEHLRELGYRAEIGDLSTLAVSNPVQVISLADVLEHVPYPRLALQRV
jgi:2-polyprenyl-3-methyl-5-hydroxy-6-metoxy-1,4-benzoquinol methylase